MNKQRIFVIIVLAVSVVLAVVSFIILPDTVITQFSVGSSNVTTMPKLVGIAIPFGLSAGGALVSLFAKGNDNTRKKSMVVSAIGLLVFVILIVVNKLNL